MWWTRQRKKKNRYQGVGSREQGLDKGLNPIPSTLNPEQGFTLIELMVAASILGLIGLAILTTFGSGFSVYERVQAYGGTQADALLALEEIERDVRNIFQMPTIPVEGGSDRVAFPAIIETVEEGEG